MPTYGPDAIPYSKLTSALIDSCLKKLPHRLRQRITEHCVLRVMEILEHWSHEYPLVEENIRDCNVEVVYHEARGRRVPKLVVLVPFESLRAQEASGLLRLQLRFRSDRVRVYPNI